MTEQQTSTAPITAARLREWVKDAQPGAQMVYAKGHAASAGALLRDEVQRLGHRGLGLIAEHYVRRPGWSEGENMVRRTDKPLPRGVVL